MRWCVCSGCVCVVGVYVWCLYGDALCPDDGYDFDMIIDFLNDNGYGDVVIV